MADANLTAERLRELLHYDAATGNFTYRVDRRNGSKAGDIAGWIAQRGLRTIEVDQRNYKAHRLVWLYVHGDWPKGVIDHIDGNPSDNRLANLRDVTQQTNLQNQRQASSVTSSGLLGAHWDAGRRLWKANIGVGRKQKFLGRFGTAEEAHQAYLTAKRKLHEGCTI